MRHVATVALLLLSVTSASSCGSTGKATGEACSPGAADKPALPLYDPFDWFFSDPFFRAPTFHTMLAPYESTLNLAAHEVEGGVEVELEVPRYRAEDIKVTTSVDTGLVTIEGRRGEKKDPTSTHTATSVPAFKRSFTVSPHRYDLTKLTSKVEDGLLVIRIPSKPVETPKKLEAKAHPVAIAGTLVPQITEAKTEAKEKDSGKLSIWGAMPQWPPRLQVAERSAPGLALTYSVALPDKVTPENVKLQVYDDGSLRVDVAYSQRKESEHGFEEHSASFTRFLQLPEGTPQDAVSARFEGGQLKIDVKEAPKKQ